MFSRLVKQLEKYSKFDYDMLVCIYIYYMYIPRTQMTNILKDLTHKMQGQTHKKEVSWVLGIIYIYREFIVVYIYRLFLRLVCLTNSEFFQCRFFVNFMRS